MDVNLDLEDALKPVKQAAQNYWDVCIFSDARPHLAMEQLGYAALNMCVKMSYLTPAMPERHIPQTEWDAAVQYGRQRGGLEEKYRSAREISRLWRERSAVYSENQRLKAELANLQATLDDITTANEERPY